VSGSADVYMAMMWTFFAFVRSARRWFATDPRYLICGILGVVNGNIGLEADYILSIAEVFTRAAMHIIR
jgi:hypothetical protein